jgi:NAD(P)H-hydrate repair Nnr-like enzyme with NAD(P)H-hydrate epimerase domain
MDPGIKILSSAQNKQCDALTTAEEGMNNHDLMDRATARIFQYLQHQLSGNIPVTFICGPGNNGADGLCLALMSATKGYSVETKICLLGKPPSAELDFRMNLPYKRIRSSLMPFLGQGSPHRYNTNGHRLFIPSIIKTDISFP